MKIFKWSIVCIFSIFMGFYVGICSTQYNRMLDEYAYFIRVNDMLYETRGKDIGDLRKEMNKLLFLHFNRYVVFRQTPPKFLTNEIDERMCGYFIMTPDTFQIYKGQVDAKVYAYINKNLDFCPFTLESRSGVNQPR